MTSNSISNISSLNISELNNNSIDKSNKRTRTSVLKKRIEKITNKIVQFVNNNTIFKKPDYTLTVDIVQKDDGVVLVFFNLTEETYVIGKYLNTASGSCTYVSSDLGMKTGTFLFHLLLLLNVELGVEDFTLDNFTEVQERGAKGIYKLLSVDKRGEDASLFIGASLKKQLSEALGKMRLKLRGNTKDKILKEFGNIMKKLEKIKEQEINTINSDSPWNPDFVSGIKKFLSDMKQQAFYATVGKKHKKSKSKSKSKKGKAKKNKKSQKKLRSYLVKTK